MASTRSTRRGGGATASTTTVNSVSTTITMSDTLASPIAAPTGNFNATGGAGLGGGNGNAGGDAITYPAGCKDVNEDMHVDELIRRLKALATCFQGMGQEENAYDEYVPLCLHLAEDGFLNHQSKDVRLLVACCIADILRIYAPEAPYKDQEQVKIIFKFLIGQLEGLKDPKDAAFKRYFYLLENLAYVKSFNMCFELDDAQDIFCKLFELIFQIVNDEHSGKVKSFMLDVLCPLVSECDTVSNELLNIILTNIVEPVKTSKKNAYNLAKELIIKCSETLEPYIQNFFNQVLICGREENNLFICQKVYDLIYELNHICPTILLAVIPQLEYKLKSTEESERLGSVSLLARMFSEKESTLAVHHAQLWQAFLGRFNDINVGIRIKCVQYSMHFLINHPELRTDIVETLKGRQHDSEENVRFEVVKAIVATAKHDFSVVSESEDLLSYVKERILDKKFKIRREALQGLALIYKTHLTASYVPAATRQAVTWMKDKILHAYYMSSLDDRILVERLVNTCLVPYQLDAHERMLRLLYLYGTIDDNASKAFIEIQKNLLLVRRHVNDLLQYVKSFDTRGSEYERQLNLKISTLTKYLPDPVKALEFLYKFCVDLKNDKTLMKTMEIIVSPTTDCKACADCVNMVLKKLGAPVMTNLYYNTIKILLERISSVLIDKEAVGVSSGGGIGRLLHIRSDMERPRTEGRTMRICILRQKLLTMMHNIVNNTEGILEELGLSKPVAMDRGLRLISVLAFVFPTHFSDESTLELLIGLMKCVTEDVIPTILSSLTYIGKGNRPLGLSHPSLMATLVPQCQNMLVTGDPKQGKAAVRCLFTNMKESARNHAFTQVLGSLRDNLDPSNSNYRTCIVALGHIAQLMPEEFRSDMKQIISQKIVKDLLVNPQRADEDRYRTGNGNWCDMEELPEITQCMISAMKTTVRWLIGLKNDLKSASKTYKMLIAFVQTGGTFIDAKIPFSNAETSWLRLAAGCCMLKICEQKGVGDQFTASQFCDLSVLMTDEVLEVRSRFSAKLHKGLSRGIPHKCLPLDFMGYYALGGYEEDRKQRNLIKSYMLNDVAKRREYIKSLMITTSEKASEQLPHIMPDYMLVFAVPVLTHHSRFTNYEDQDELTEIKDCLWFILEPLIVKSETYSFGFYKTLVERMKNHKSTIDSENDQVHNRMYAICDIALGLILQRSQSFEMKEYPSEPRIPPMYFKRHETPYWTNTRSYLPPDMQYAPPKKAGVLISVETGPSKRQVKKPKKEVVTVDEHGNVSIDAEPTDYHETCLEIPGLKAQETDSDDEADLAATKINNNVDQMETNHTHQLTANKQAEVQRETRRQASRKQVILKRQSANSQELVQIETQSASENQEDGTPHSILTRTRSGRRSSTKVVTFCLPEEPAQLTGNEGVDGAEEEGPPILTPEVNNEVEDMEEIVLEELVEPEPVIPVIEANNSPSTPVVQTRRGRIRNAAEDLAPTNIRETRKRGRKV